MRTIVISILAIYSFNVIEAQGADDPKPAEPTEKQLEDAKEAYGKFGAKYKSYKTLTSLNLDGTQVTDAGIKELKEALPKCQIFKKSAAKPMNSKF